MQKSPHHIKTGYGISGPIYRDNFVPLSGFGQGNGLRPLLWVLISTVILTMCKKASHGMKFFTSITKLPISFMGYLFVDNADIVQGYGDVNTSGKALIPNFQESMKRWNGGIRDSGGSIFPNKTKWFLIDFKYNGKDYEYRSIEDMPGNILIPDKE